MMRLHTKIYVVGDISDRMINEMYTIFDRYYDCIRFDVFERDLQDKTHVMVLYDGNRLVGFSTAYAGKQPHTNATILFSGDTVLEEAYWGNKILQQAFYKFMWMVYIKAPWRPIYWMLMSKGYKTYLLMRCNFPRSYPNHHHSTPKTLLQAKNTFYRVKYGDAFKEKESLLQFPISRGQLKTGVISVDEKDLEHPDIRFFHVCNPGASHGDELACIAKITLLDLIQSGVKHLAKWVAIKKQKNLSKSKTNYKGELDLRRLLP